MFWARLISSAATTWPLSAHRRVISISARSA
jgi:hypothetical protein